MDKIAGYNTDDLKSAVKQIKKRKPDYALMLDLYEKIYIAQEKSISLVQLDDFRIPGDILSAKLKEQFPLLNISQFIIDSKASEKLFKKLCGMLIDAGNEIADSVKKITDLADENKLNLNGIFSAFLSENESVFDEMEKEFNIDKQVLGFITYNSLKPSLSAFSQMVSDYLNKDKSWDKGYCPVCGSAPEISVFEENGKRFLLCGFCTHKWESKRIYCPFCENTDHESIHYFEMEDEEEYRVDVCDRCKKYIKTIDINKTSRTIYLPLENQSTPYIDLKFEQMGFKSGSVKS